MKDHSIDPSEEACHEPGKEPLWNESYYFDFHDPEGSLGGYVRIGLYPNLGVTWYWACLVGADRPLVTVIAHDVPSPDTASLQIRQDGLEADHPCLVPTRSFGVRLDAVATALLDPAEVYGSMLGQRIRLAFDLSWETDGPGGYRFRDLSRYEIPCNVQGTIRVGDESIDFVGHGQRDHSWGVRDWWTHAWCWNAGRMDDGTRFHSVAPRTLDGQDIPWSAGYIQPPGKALAPIQSSRATEQLDKHGLPTQGQVEVGDLHLNVTPRYFSPVLLTAPDGRISRFPRCLAQYTDPEGREGLGWIEWNQPQPG